MNNTILSAKNSFLEGLIMDFSPELTLAGCLTNALNATLLTFNGNEMALQNDMGNARVETARLPDGYIPVGTCEFGDIIYIVSYNPLTNKSLIGCFPSPERNISSEEIGGLGQTLSASDFQVLDGNTPTGKLKATSVKKILMEKSLNPGDKFIIYDTNKVIQSEKFITDIGNTSHDYGKFPKLVKIHVVAIEDSGKINYLDSSLKWYEIEKGTPENLTYHDFFISELVNNEDSNKPDIDSYRNLLSSGYSVFQSKVSGKLALLIELEKISGFSCTKSVTKSGNTYSVTLNTSWETSNYDINPKGYIVKTSSESSDIFKDGKYDEYFEYTRHYKPEGKISYSEFSEKSFDLIKNNISYNKVNFLGDLQVVFDAQLDSEGYYFLLGTEKKYVYKDGQVVSGNITKLNEGEPKNTESFIHNFFKVDIPKSYYTLESETNNLLHSYEVIPCMPYGQLDEFAVKDYIDFSKIDSGNIDITEWRYYKNLDILTLTFGILAYPEPGKGISKVVLRFYDNNGEAGYIELKDRKSYSGVFTLIIQLNLEDAIKHDKGHCGDLLEGEIPEDWLPKGDPNRSVHDYIEALKGNKYYDDEFNETLPHTIISQLLKSNIITSKQVDGQNYYYFSDAGTLYSNLLYLVKIEIHVLEYNTFGDFNSEESTSPKIIYKYIWTNEMWNEEYYNKKDFSLLYPKLDLTVLGSFSNNAKLVKTSHYKANTTINDENTSILSRTLGYDGYIVYHSDYLNDYKKYTNVGTKYENMGMCILPIIANTYNTFSINPKQYGNIEYTIYEEPEYIEVDLNPKKIYPEGVSYHLDEILLNPVIEKPADDSLYDYFLLISLNTETNTTISDVEYYVNNLIKSTKGYKRYTIDASKFKDDDLNPKYYIKLCLQGAFYSKIAALGYNLKYKACRIYKPILENLDETELNKFNLTKVLWIPNNASETSHYYFAFKNLYNFGTGLFSGSLIEKLGTNSLGMLYYMKEEVSLGRSIHTSMLQALSLFENLLEGPFIPIMFITNHDDGGRAYMQKTNGLTSGTMESIKNSWILLFGTTADDATNLQFISTDFISEDSTILDNIAIVDTNNKTLVMQLALKSSTNLIIPLNVFCRVFPEKYNLETYRAATLHFGYGASTYAQLKTINGFNSLADIVASFLSQTFVLTDSVQNQEIKVVSDFIINAPFTEIWNKRFIVNPNINNIKQTLTISNIPYDEYLVNLNKINGTDIITNDSDIITNNTDILFNENLSLLKFEHVCNYDPSKLLSDYSAAQHNLGDILCYVQSDAFNAIKSGFIDYKLDVMYLLKNADNIYSLTDDVTKYLIPIKADTGELNTNLTNTIQFSDFIRGTTSGFLKIKKGNIVEALKLGTDNLFFRRSSSDDWNEWYSLSLYNGNTIKDFGI